MPPKRPLSDTTTTTTTTSSQPVAKRPRPSSHAPAAPSSSHQTAAAAPPDRLSPLSDELLLRILAALTPAQLLRALAPVSRRFHRLTQDAQLWKALYYARFVLPRALRLPGFRRRRRHGDAPREQKKLHYKGRRALWADGRLGGLVREEDEGDEHEVLAAGGGGGGSGGGYPASKLRIAKWDAQEAGAKDQGVNWMRQFKIRHNWARGKCAVEELKLGPDPHSREHTPGADDEGDRAKMLVKVVEGLAVTADARFGLRAWDLKTREVMAQIELQDDRHEDESTPSCMAIDDRGLDKGTLDISVGFADGSFGVWRLDEHKCLVRRYRHEKSSNGELMGMAYLHPYLLTATGAVLLSLYTFDVPEKPEADDKDQDASESNIEHIPPPSRTTNTNTEGLLANPIQPNATSLPAPYLMTSLKSHTADPPLALSIRKTGNTTIASIAYTFFARRGWSIGIQDLHITAHPNPKRTPNITTRLAHTTPADTGTPYQIPGPTTPPRPLARSRLASPPHSAAVDPPSPAPRGPTTLSYTHPYLLATLPDNTLILHLCTSTAVALAISPGIRLWGHTSGISDAEITARGKAVSVSSRGDEMRVWELEGRPSGVRSSRSVEIRPGGVVKEEEEEEEKGAGVVDWEARRNWVGFDDEMVIVLKEARGGRESLLVYDFT